MSTFFHSDVWVISRRKLQKAESDESGDTLRRSVLIHNIIKQHSLPPSPTHYQQVHYHHQPQEQQQELSAPQQFVFPTLGEPGFEQVASATSSGEQDWLDGLLNDLDDDVHVSVVPVDELDDDVVASAPSSLFPPSSCPPQSHHQPEPQYTLEALPSDSLRSLFFTGDPTSPPTSPPGLMEHNIDSDDDEDEWDPMCSTPSASTDCLGAGRVVAQPSQDPEYFFHMPFQRHRPALAPHHFIMR